MDAHTERGAVALQVGISSASFTQCSLQVQLQDFSDHSRAGTEKGACPSLHHALSKQWKPHSRSAEAAIPVGHRR